MPVADRTHGDTYRYINCTFVFSLFLSTLEQENKETLEKIRNLPNGSPEKSALENKMRKNKSVLTRLKETGNVVFKFVVDKGKLALEVAKEKGSKK